MTHDLPPREHDLSDKTFYQFVITNLFFFFIYRVATDLKTLETSRNFKETSESQAICLKIQGTCGKIPKVREKSVNFVS